MACDACSRALRRSTGVNAAVGWTALINYRQVPLRTLMSQNSGGFDSCRNRSSTGENPVEIDDTDPETLYPSSSRTSFESITWPDSLAGAGSGKDPALSADISMSRNIIIAIAAIGAFTSSAAARERRPEIV